MVDFQVDVNERGAPKDGVPQEANRRLFMQLLVYRVPAARAVNAPKDIAARFSEVGVPAVVYEDVNDPASVGVLTFSEDPGHFVGAVRKTLQGIPELEARSDMTMFGRTYSSGYEQDLLHWIIEKPQSTVMEEKWPWAVWYPLRRNGAFAQLEGREQGKILKEHAIIGRAYGAKDLAHDVRLACHGIDVNDNEFVIGLIGKELHPLSHVVQTMRKTRQTSEFIEKMGPFFIGRVAARSRV